MLFSPEIEKYYVFQSLLDFLNLIYLVESYRIAFRVCPERILRKTDFILIFQMQYFDIQFLLLLKVCNNWEPFDRKPSYLQVLKYW